MHHAPLSALRLPRRLVAVLLAFVAMGAVGLAVTPVPASAQLVDTTGQTKEQARAARDATDSADGGGSLPLSVWLMIGAVLVIGTATYFIFRDAGSSVGMDERRRAPERDPIQRGDVRAVPKQMFEGESSSANPRGKAKKRDKAKRQKQARRANRPRR